MLPSWPQFSENEIEKVKEILLSGKVNYWTGQEGKNFEKEFATWCGTNYSIAISNGSLALTAAYMSLGIGEGDEVITTPRTFIATASTIVLLKAKPIFADVDPDSGAITVESIEPLITKKTKAISVVHLGGWPADIKSICELANSYDLYVVEDCAQAHGAKVRINGEFKSVGSFGDVSAWSFCQDKIISTGGEGGMITTNQENLWKDISSIKDHGKNIDAVLNKTNSLGFRFLHEKFGSNFRLTEIQSSIGRHQFKYLSEWNKIRNKNAQILIEKLSNLSSIRIPIPNNEIEHAYYKFYAFLKKDSLLSDWSRERILREISNNGYPALTGTCGEIYLEKCFQESGFFPAKRLPIARELGETSLMFLVHPSINSLQMYEYACCISKILLKASR